MSPHAGRVVWQGVCVCNSVYCTPVQGFDCGEKFISTLAELLASNRVILITDAKTVFSARTVSLWW